MKALGKQSFWKLAFWVMAIGLLLTMMLISNDYALTNDEPIHQLHGELLLQHYQTGESPASLSPFNDDGTIVKTIHAINDNKIRGMNFFGGSFDLLVNALHPYFKNIGLYHFRHYVNLVFGFLVMLFVGLLIRELSDWKWAVIGLLMIALTPRLFGHSFNNPKDIPFAFTYISGLYFTIRFIRRLPKIDLLSALFLPVILALSISVRVSGLLLIGYIGLGFLMTFINDNQKPIAARFITYIMPATVLLLGIIGGYLATSLLWPYMQLDLFAPFKVLTEVSNFTVFSAFELFNGEWLVGKDLPLSYIPVWLFMTLPLFAMIGIVFAVPLLFQKEYKNSVSIGLLFFAVLFPVIFIIQQHSTIYNGIRHLLFILGPVSLLSTLGWRYMFQKWGRTYLRYSLIFILTACLLESGVWMVKSHPYQNMYFNSLVGGVDQAFGKYEIDYWGASCKEAVEWIDENTPSKSKKNPIRVKMFFGDRDKVVYYSDSIEGMDYLIGNQSVGWDYEIKPLSYAKFDKQLLTNWPPPNTVHQIHAAGTPICAIIKADNSESRIQHLLLEAKKESEFIDLSMLLYYKSRNVECINQSKRGLLLFPKSVELHSNIGSAFNNLGMYYSAEPYLVKAIELDESKTNALHNLAYGQTANKHYDDESFLINASLYAYQTKEFKDCIWYAQKCLELNPKNAFAYNNMGSAYSALEMYKKAEESFINALKWDPSHERAKNNLAFCRKQLN